MSELSGILQRAGLIIAAGMSLAAVSTTARACDCSDDDYRYYRHHDDAYNNWSCYGGGYDCGYERSHYRPYYARRYYRDGNDWRYRYDSRYRYDDCYRDCR